VGIDLKKQPDYIEYKVLAIEKIDKLDYTIKEITSITSNLENIIKENCKLDLSKINFQNITLSVDFPTDVSISKMKSFITNEDKENEDDEEIYDYEEFNQEVKLINFQMIYLTF